MPFNMVAGRSGMGDAKKQRDTENNRSRVLSKSEEYKQGDCIRKNFNNKIITHCHSIVSMPL